jgi:class 3 adenylate cyclase/pimeloyl-ACP methyl ester carboxylesterase
MSELRRWLQSLALERYADAFESGDIDLDVLPELDHEILKEIGVASPGDRLRILKAAKQLAMEVVPAGSAPPPRATPPPVEHLDRGGDAERRQLTVMFCDLVGSTALSETLDPEDLREVINAFQQCAAETTERIGGHVARFMGDGILVYFGYPRADEHDAERAVRAGLAVVDAVSHIQTNAGQRLQTRIGIATGLVVVGDLMESSMAKEHAVVGETPNMAARLQALAGPDQTVVGDLTRRLARDTFEFEDLGARSLKGFSEPVQLWRAVGEGRGRGAGHRAPGVDRNLPLIGRERDVELLVNRWETAAEGDGQVILLSGQAGMGKTRILGALLAAIDERPHTAIRYFCSPHHAASALHPVTEQLIRAAGIVEGDSPGIRHDKLAALIRNPVYGIPEPLAQDSIRDLCGLLGIDVAGHAGPGNPTAEQKKERTLDALVDLLCAMSAVAPVLVALEDAQWADPTTCELFDAFAERAQDLPVLLVVTFRDDFRPPWADLSHVTSLTLNRLRTREVSEMVLAVSGGRRMPETVHERIVASTDGVPLFVEELTRSVLESGLLAERAGHLELTGPLPPLAIPATLHDSLMARLDRLDAAKEIAQTGAAMGRSFTRSVVEAVCDLPAAEVDAGLTRLEQSGILIRRGRGAGSRYTFKHALMQEVAYQSLLKSRRQVLHMRIAGVLAERFPEVVANQPEILARQYSEAGLAGNAARSWLLAARRAKDVAAYVEAESHVSALLLVCEQLDDGAERDGYSARAHSIQGDIESLRGRLEAANESYEHALAIARDPEQIRDIEARLHQVRETTSDGARIVYYVHGRGRQTLLFVNPIAYGLALFQPVLERLCHEFRIVTIDCRGAGRSDALVRPYGIEQHARDTAAVIDDLADGPVIGVGVSRGGSQLVRLAAQRPDQVQAVVLVGTPLVVTRDTAIQTDSVHAGAQLGALEQGDWEKLYDAFARSLYTEPAVRHLAKQFVTGCAALPHETMLSFFDGDAKLDVRELLPAIRYPVLITHGSDDQRVSVEAARGFEAAIPGSSVHVFEGKGHLPLFSAPEEFCTVLRAFVGESVPLV